jgi:signal peptide peptidase SppA
MQPIDHVLAYARTMAWALRADYGETLATILVRRALGRGMDAQTAVDVKASRDALEARRAEASSAPAGVAVIPVLGVLMPRASMIDESSGISSPESIGRSIDRALADAGVKTIVLDVNSPGGAVAGIPELAAKIRAAREQKQVVAQISYQAASAAYWLASQADEIVVSPSGEVGSIGVYAMRQDLTEAAKKDGVAVTLVSAGKFKVEDNPFVPLSDDARANLQSYVDAAYGDFTNDVAKGRGVSAATARGAKFGEGRMKRATDAVASGMADRVATMDETLARFVGGGRVKSRAGAHAEAVVEELAAVVTDSLLRAAVDDVVATLTSEELDDLDLRERE